jgi:hypothetical protein
LGLFKRRYEAGVNHLLLAFHGEGEAVTTAGKVGEFDADTADRALHQQPGKLTQVTSRVTGIEVILSGAALEDLVDADVTGAQLFPVVPLVQQCQQVHVMQIDIDVCVAPAAACA